MELDVMLDESWKKLCFHEKRQIFQENYAFKLIFYVFVKNVFIPEIWHGGEGFCACVVMIMSKWAILTFGMPHFITTATHLTLFSLELSEKWKTFQRHMAWQAYWWLNNNEMIPRHCHCVNLLFSTLEFTSKCNCPLVNSTNQATRAYLPIYQLYLYTKFTVTRAFLEFWMENNVLLNTYKYIRHFTFIHSHYLDYFVCLSAIISL